MRHLLELCLFFLVLMGLPDWYIYRTYVKCWKSRWMRYIHWLPSLLLLGGMAYTFLGFAPNSGALHRLGVYLIFFLCLVVPKALFTLTDLLLKPLARKVKHPHAGSLVALGLSLLVMGYLVFGAIEGKQHYQTKEVTIASADIPEAFDGYRIVQISDLHTGSWGNHTKPFQKAVDMINAHQPDLVVFTGDLVNNLATELDAFIPVLSQLQAKHGVYSVLGNHDYSMYVPWETPEAQAANLQSLKEKQAQMGWTLLNNQSVKLYQGTDSIALIGVENSGRPPFPDHAHLKEAMNGTEGMFSILLSHDPSHWRREVLPDTDIQLMLSGHTHDMQTRILGFSPSALIYPEHSGLYQEDNQMLYVNVGLGFLMYPMRLGAWPEITLLTLKKIN